MYYIDLKFEFRIHAFESGRMKEKFSKYLRAFWKINTNRFFNIQFYKLLVDISQIY